MKPQKLKFEVALEVSDRTAATCLMALNVYLLDHPGADVDVYTEILPDGTPRRKISLRNGEERNNDRD